MKEGFMELLSVGQIVIIVLAGQLALAVRLSAPRASIMHAAVAFQNMIMWTVTHGGHRQRVT